MGMFLSLVTASLIGFPIAITFDFGTLSWPFVCGIWIALNEITEEKNGKS